MIERVSPGPCIEGREHLSCNEEDLEGRRNISPADRMREISGPGSHERLWRAPR